ncbi:hypothetical protein [Spirulina sp. CCNP1310]|uniref:hypothetical protein n=1 Tax=Spirulina sp. CCNP1310 TaxID=3110249 RepID=UPI002B1F2167|nr:hypothetical protein [Spirulina sp. CCNP1310]
MRLEDLAAFFNRIMAESKQEGLNELKKLENLLMIIIVQLTLLIMEGWELLTELDKWLR